MHDHHVLFRLVGPFCSQLAARRFFLHHINGVTWLSHKGRRRRADIPGTHIHTTHTHRRSSDNSKGEVATLHYSLVGRYIFCSLCTFLLTAGIHRTHQHAIDAHMRSIMIPNFPLLEALRHTQTPSEHKQSARQNGYVPSLEHSQFGV